METILSAHMPCEALLERIHAILLELLELRQAIASQARDARRNVTLQLFAALGRGAWEEYDLTIDWQRLGQ